MAHVLILSRKNILKETLKRGEGRFGGPAALRWDFLCGGNMRNLYIKSYGRVGLAASVDMRIFLEFWDSQCPEYNIIKTLFYT